MAERVKGRKGPRYVFLLILAAYLLAVAGCTVYANQRHRDTLPLVELVRLQPREIHYTARGTAVMEDGRLLYSFPERVVLPAGIIEVGCRVEINGEDAGFVEEIIPKETTFDCAIQVENGSLSEGETVEVAIKGHTRRFEKTLPRGALTLEDGPGASVNLIEEQDGSWGKAYFVRQQPVAYYWPENSEFVMVPDSFEAEEPAAVGNGLFGGAEVKLW